jgi:hypothetical protein
MNICDERAIPEILQIGGKITFHPQKTTFQGKFPKDQKGRRAARP